MPAPENDVSQLRSSKPRSIHTVDNPWGHRKKQNTLSFHHVRIKNQPSFQLSLNHGHVHSISCMLTVTTWLQRQPAETRLLASQPCRLHPYQPCRRPCTQKPDLTAQQEHDTVYTSSTMVAWPHTSAFLPSAAQGRNLDYAAQQNSDYPTRSYVFIQTSSRSAKPLNHSETVTYDATTASYSATTNLLDAGLLRHHA